MSVLLLCYDLQQPRRNHDALWTILGKYPHCRAAESAWLLDTENTTDNVRDQLSPLLGENDQVCVIRLHCDWAACQKLLCDDWLTDPVRSWD